MREYPVTVGHRLSEPEELLLRYWLERTVPGRWQNHAHGAGSPPSDLSRMHFMPQCDIRTAEELLSWFLPVLIFAGENSEITPFLSAGAVAIQRLDHRSPILLPPAELPPRSSAVFVISDDGLFRLRIRQILRFAGREPRMDFAASEDIAQVLTSVDEWPELIVVDLDSKRIDVVEFIYRTEKILRERPGMRTKNQMMMVKDFARPGLDPVKLRPVLAPHAKRIFHPHEALLAVLETMIFAGADPGFSPEPPPRSLAEMLYGDDFSPPGRIHESFLSFLQGQGERLSRGLPFLIFARYLKDALLEQGAGSLAMK